MKTTQYFLAIVLLAAGSSVNAQAGHHMAREMHDIRHDRRDIHHDRKDIHSDVKDMIRMIFQPIKLT
jgi:hypothetical protein